MRVLAAYDDRSQITKKIEKLANQQEKRQPKVEPKKVPLNRRATIMPTNPMRKLNAGDSFKSPILKRMSACPDKTSPDSRRLTEKKHSNQSPDTIQ